MSKRILVIEDHEENRRLLRDLLTSVGYELIEAVTGEEGLTAAEAQLPDLILMDIQLPGINGIEATRQIVQASPHIRVLMVTMFEEDQSVFTAMRAGARGYLLKGAQYDEMLRAIRAVGNGEAIFSPSIATRFLDYFGSMRPATAPAVFPELSEREREILGLIAHGCKNAEIADRLVLTPKTVRNHVSNILSKLQVADRAEAIVRARDAGLG